MFDPSNFPMDKRNRTSVLQRIYNGVACNVPDFIEAKKLLKCFKTVAINISQENIPSHQINNFILKIGMRQR